MFELGFYPLYGLVFGIDYFNDEMENVQISDEKRHSLTIYLLLIGISVSWYSERK